MHPLLIELSGKFDLITTRGQTFYAIAGFEKVYDALGDSEQKTLRRLIEELYRRLAR